jgi:UDP-N-acetylmuramate--alanine ligase
MESRSPSKFTGQRVHFIGIGGSGMSGLARMLLDNGAIVSGSEPTPNATSLELTSKRNVKISRDQIGQLISRETNLVVRTAAVPDSNLEYQRAKALGIPTIKYSELLGQVMAERNGVAICGTHGKSTTTAMVSYALLSCGLDPSFVVGGTVPQLGGGSRSGFGSAFVAEACEFDRSFHALRPKIAVVLNIEEDHLDCYKDINDIVESFRTFIRLLPADGLVIANGQDARVQQALNGLNVRRQMVGMSDGFDWSVRETGVGKNGCPTGDVYHQDKHVATLKLSVAGRHNLYNATTAIAVAVACGAQAQQAADAVSQFVGVDRRMTIMGEFAGATVVDDYGHHPTEIRATLAALRERFQPKRLICVFQPHQHSRTRFLLDDFAVSFKAADETILPDIYFVRDSEEERQRVSSQDLVDRIRNNGQKALHLATFSEITSHLKRTSQSGDLIVTMGAGNVWEIGRDLVG